MTLEAAEMSLEEAKKWTALQFLVFIVKWNFCESLPSLSLCLRFFSTIRASIASCERSFSKLKLMHGVGQDRRQTWICFQSNMNYANEVNLDEVIDQFAEIKD